MLDFLFWGIIPLPSAITFLIGKIDGYTFCQSHENSMKLFGFHEFQPNAYRNV